MTDEDRVRQLAYSIWEAEGRPEGEQQRHWDRALKIVAAEQAAGNEAELEDMVEPLDESPILEDDLPLEEDEMGIQENRLPLDDPEQDPSLDEDPSLDQDPFWDETQAGQDELEPNVPAQDVPVQDVPVQDRGQSAQAPTSDDTSGSMEPLPKDSHTVARTRRPRSSDDPLSTTDEKDTSQTPAKKPGRAASSRKTTAADKAGTTTTKATKAATKTTKTPKKSTPKADKPKTTK